MTVAAKAAGKVGGFQIMFPRRTGPVARQARSNANPKGTRIALRPPKDMLDYISSIEALGYSKTDAVLRLLYVARDVVEGMGPEWWDIEAAAQKEGLTQGQVLARMALLGLRLERKR